MFQLITVAGAKDVSNPRNPEQLVDPTLPFCQRVTGFFLPLGETDHIPPSSAEVKNEWSCAYISLNAFLGWDLNMGTISESSK
jgi:hypothetical protein